MKNILLSLCIVSLLLISCKKYESATLTLSSTLDTTTFILKGQVTIVDDGGTENFTEQGYIYSFAKEPTLHDRYGTTVVVNKNAKNSSFTFEGNLPVLDTMYYIRAYTKSNGGVGYSNIDSFLTYQIDTLITK